MLKIFKEIRHFRNDRRGVTALEYGLIAGLVAVVIVSSVTALGNKLSTVFAQITAALP